MRARAVVGLGAAGLAGGKAGCAPTSPARARECMPIDFSNVDAARARAHARV